jgi:hypothetical protein
MRASGGRRAGRNHRKHDVPCQDAFAWRRSHQGTRIAAAVADGLGSRRLSHLGSQAACQAAVYRLEVEPVWDEAAVVRAFEAARAGIRFLAAQHAVAEQDLATTLQVVGLDGGTAVGGIVGDGAIVVCTPEVSVLLPPEEAEYANEVVPVTHTKWRSHLRVAQAEEAACALAFTDGLTRLLLARSEDRWAPFAPFFDAFLPKVWASDFDEGLVDRFLAADNVDSSWDDDKCMVVIGRDG